MNKYGVVIVTGASSGIGAAVARKFCLNGSKVYAIARNKKRLSAIRKSLPVQCHTKFVVTECDITDKTQVATTFQKIFKENSIDLIISNAGVGYSKPLSAHTDIEIETVLNTNLVGTINIIRAALANRSNHPLQIVCTSSLAGKIGFPEMSTYSASKFGIEGLIESLRNEYNSDEVSFTILRPGITATPFFKKAGMQDYEKSVKSLKSYFTADKVADIFYKKLTSRSRIIVIGNDRYFLKILPFVPFQYRFKVLDIINKL